ncbi:MAG: hypothetical protein ACMUHX_02505 [bacterium]
MIYIYSIIAFIGFRHLIKRKRYEDFNYNNNNSNGYDDGGALCRDDRSTAADTVRGAPGGIDAGADK